MSAPCAFCSGCLLACSVIDIVILVAFSTAIELVLFVPLTQNCGSYNAVCSAFEVPHLSCEAMVSSRMYKTWHLFLIASRRCRLRPSRKIDTHISMVKHFSGLLKQWQVHSRFFIYVDASTYSDCEFGTA